MWCQRRWLIGRLLGPPRQRTPVLGIEINETLLGSGLSLSGFGKHLLEMCPLLLESLALVKHQDQLIHRVWHQHNVRLGGWLRRNAPGSWTAARKADEAGPANIAV
jgi:hypothetical protein